jgi:hypothetical protein
MTNKSRNRKVAILTEMKSECPANISVPLHNVMNPNKIIHPNIFVFLPALGLSLPALATASKVPNSNAMLSVRFWLAGRTR